MSALKSALSCRKDSVSMLQYLLELFLRGVFAIERVGIHAFGYDKNAPLVVDPVLVYSTYLGGSGQEDGTSGGMGVDPQGNAYVLGTTTSSDFAVSKTIGTAKTDGSAVLFVTKINPTGTALVYSTYLGGTGTNIPYYNAADVPAGIAVDGSGYAYVTGRTLSADLDRKSVV